MDKAILPERHKNPSIARHLRRGRAPVEQEASNRGGLETAILKGTNDLMAEHGSLPGLYEHMIECGVVDLHPWVLLIGESKAQRAQHIDKVLPGWGVIPFARRTDDDDVACWTGSKVVVIDDWDVMRDEKGAPIRHVAREYASMEEWLLDAVRDFVEFDWS